ncbi:hypothetical protein FBQ97_13540 [Acidobacteria bacterium ACD]|nr:hypothetical protein [Acidobacteria bacterium ACD]
MAAGAAVPRGAGIAWSCRTTSPRSCHAAFASGAKTASSTGPFTSISRFRIRTAPRSVFASTCLGNRSDGESQRTDSTVRPSRVWVTFQVSHSSPSRLSVPSRVADARRPSRSWT